MDQRDITQRIISDDSLRERVSSLLPDSVILDIQFNILAVSRNILEAIGFESSELVGKSISLVSYTKNLKQEIEEKLRPGYFEDEHFEIRTKTSVKINYSISGFYLGLITEVNGIIILRFKNLDEINLMYDRLEAKTTELDRFIYLSSHELRGPLATLKGLINLAKSTPAEEQAYLLQQMEIHAQKLDDRFYRLIYFAESDKGSDASTHPVKVMDIFSSLEQEISQGVAQGLNLSFASTEEQFVQNGEVALALIRNLIRFLAEQPRHHDHFVHLDVHASPHATELVLRAGNFPFDLALVDNLETVNFGYTEILHHPELINCYVAKKIVFKLRGNIQFMLSPVNELVTLVTLPNAETNSGLACSA